MALKLADGRNVTITGNNIRVIEYGGRGDAGWLTGLWNSITGNCTEAIIKLNNHKRLVVQFYKQNYIIVEKSGSKVQFQKKCVFWFNSRADELVQGWTPLEYEYVFRKHVIQNMPLNPLKPSLKVPELPSFLKERFPFEEEDYVLLQLPWNIYAVTNHDLNKAFNSLMSSALNSATSAVKNALYDKKAGLYAAKDNKIFVAAPANMFELGRKTSSHKVFIKQMFPGTFQIVFSINGNGNIKYNNVRLGQASSTKVRQGIVFGAARYGNTWKACVVVKKVK